jgi:hypothetical protein
VDLAALGLLCVCAYELCSNALGRTHSRGAFFAARNGTELARWRHAPECQMAT